MGYAAVGTWDLIPSSFPVEVKVRRRGARTPWEGSLIHRRQTFSSESAQGQAGVRRFTLTFALATKSDYNRALTLWKLSTGGSQGLSYSTTSESYSGTEVLIVRMVGAPFSITQTADNQYSFKIVLEEMLDAP